MRRKLKMLQIYVRKLNQGHQWKSQHNTNSLDTKFKTRKTHLFLESFIRSWLVFLKLRYLLQLLQQNHFSFVSGTRNYFLLVSFQIKEYG